MGSSITYWLFNELKYSLRLIFKIPNVHFFHYWENVGSPVRATFKNSIFNLFVTWKYSLRLTFINPNFESPDELVKFMS